MHLKLGFGALSLRQLPHPAAALFFVACAACSAKDNPAAPEAGSHNSASGTGGGQPSDAESSGTPGIRWIGRVDASDPAAMRFSWSGTGLLATVSGTTISAKLRTTGSDIIYFQPVIDGTPGARFAVPSGEMTATLGSNLAAGDHRVELYRETEGRYGYSTFEGFTEGTLKAPPASSGRVLEFVGDSITAGYGDLGMEQHPNYGPDPAGGCHFSTQTESAYVTYGAVAARALGADASLLAVSGWGIYRDNGQSTANVMPAVYSNTLGLQTSPAWSFQVEPQAVIINLGTNDFANLMDPGMTAFETAFTNFIGTIRGKYPNAVIFCTVGPLLYSTGLTQATAYIHDVISHANSNGDTKIRYLDFGQQNILLGTGCDYHPNVAEHQMMADELVAALKNALGWQ